METVIKIKVKDAVFAPHTGSTQSEIAAHKNLRIEFDAERRLFVLTALVPDGKAKTKEGEEPPMIPNPNRRPVMVGLENVCWWM